MRATSVEIAGAFNARAFGHPTAWLVRSSNLDAVDADGASTLRDLGVTTIVDLRSEGERRDPAVDARVVSVPLYDGVAPVQGAIDDVYAGLVEHRGEQIAAAVAAIADARGATLVHCAVGKDRTGIVCGLTLAAIGVSDDDIAADYALSATTDERFAAWARTVTPAGQELPAPLPAPAEAMRYFLAEVRREHGSVEGYLRHTGVRQSQLDALRAHLLV